MRVQDLLNTLLLRLDREEESWQLVTAREIQSWPNGVFDALYNHGLFEEAVHSDHYRCDNCDDDHDEEVIVLESEPGSGLPNRIYINCPTTGRVRVTPEKLKQWRIIPQGLVQVTEKLLNIKNPYRELIPDRAWSLGIADLNGISKEILIVRGLTWGDGASIRQQVSKGVNSSSQLILNTILFTF